MILIVYTTHYREGSDKFAVIAETLKDELNSLSSEIVCKGIHGKKELLKIFDDISLSGKKINEFHFVGHSGMYGPMYGTVEYPEQFSPFEWKNMKIPFDLNAKAYFHCCRSARWFAPFFADLFQVETFGYYLYTSFSQNKNKFKRIARNEKPMYAAGCIGRKSHGWMGSLKKHFTSPELEKLIPFSPRNEKIDSSYNKVAELYADAFSDITVRKDEWNWLMKHFPKNKKPVVLDIGCGNGALLNALSPMIESGKGIDASVAIIEEAKKRQSNFAHLTFEKIDGPNIPMENQSVDLIISLLSFRYLDWDPLMDEIKRVLRPGGKVIIIDMVTVPVKWYEIPDLLISKGKQYMQRRTQADFYNRLTKLVAHPDWKEMLKYNPIRAEHEMKWYLESRFPGRKIEKINIGWNSSMLAFDSGSIENIKDINLTYP